MIGCILAKVDLREVLILQTTFDHIMFSQVIEKWKASGTLELYIFHYYFDFLHPLFYAFFLASIMSRAFVKCIYNKRISLVILLPFIAGVFDIIENLLHLYMINSGLISEGLVKTSASFTNMKWMIVFLCLLIAFLIHIRNRSVRKQNKISF